jgi:hypothetical protein
LSSITIPKTIESAKTALGEVGALLTAKSWERAAIVYAFTGPGQPGPQGNRPATPRISFADFARLGIVGLTDNNTVSDYHEAWDKAIKAGAASEVKPGDTISLPKLPWPPGQTSRRGSHGTETEARAYIARNPQVAVDAVKAVPAVAAAVTTAIAHDTDLTNEVERKAFAKRIGAKDNGPSVPTTTIPTFDYEKRLSAAITVVSEAIKDEQSGAWTPGPGEAAMLTVLYLNLKDRADRYAAAQPVVHSEIDAFLRESNTAKED